MKTRSTSSQAAGKRRTEKTPRAREKKKTVKVVAAAEPNRFSTWDNEDDPEDNTDALCQSPEVARDKEEDDNNNEEHGENEEDDGENEEDDGENEEDDESSEKT